jgi:hypothetical protein
VVNAALDLGAVLNVFKNRVGAHRHCFDVHDGIHTRPGEIIILKLAERSLGLSHFGRNFSLENDFRPGGHFKIHRPAFHQLDIFLQQCRSDLEFVHTVLRRCRRREIVHRMVSDHDRHRHRLVLLLVDLIIGPGVAWI